MSDAGRATDPVGTAAGPGQDVHGYYERLTLIKQHNNSCQASGLVQLLCYGQAANLGCGFQAWFGRQLLCHT